MLLFYDVRDPTRMHNRGVSGTELIIYVMFAFAENLLYINTYWGVGVIRVAPYSPRPPVCLPFSPASPCEKRDVCVFQNSLVVVVFLGCKGEREFSPRPDTCNAAPCNLLDMSPARFPSLFLSLLWHQPGVQLVPPPTGVSERSALQYLSTPPTPRLCGITVDARVPYSNNILLRLPRLPQQTFVTPSSIPLWYCARCASYALDLHLPSLWTTRPDIYHPAASVVAPLIRTGCMTNPSGLRHGLVTTSLGKEGSGGGGVVANRRVLL